MHLVVNPMSFTSSSVSWKSNDAVSDQFPAGLRVLVVDDDPTCLKILEKMLRNCLYEVTKCCRADIALKLLRDNKDGYDIVISDVHMPDMDGFKLLEHVGLEMDLPVIMMSADDSKDVVMKGVTHGACDYLIKPVRMEALKNIWQHVVRKKKHEWKEKDYEHSGSIEDGAWQQKPSEDVDYSSSANEGSWKSSKKRKDEDDEAEERDDSTTLKKPRVVWSVELHQQFVTAVNQLGIDKAVPKKILELMNVPGLTRENVASHLQKYRIYLKRLSGQHQNGLGGSFVESQDAAFGAVTSCNGLDLRALASSGQLQPQSLATIQAAALGRATKKSPLSMPVADQRNLFSFDGPKIRFMDGQQHASNSLLHGVPTNMDSKQRAALHKSSQPFGNINMHVQSQSKWSHSLLTQMVQSQLRPQLLNEVGRSHVLNSPSSVGSSGLSQTLPGAVLGRNGIEGVHESSYTPVSQPSTVNQRPDFSGNTFPLVSNSGISALTSKGTLQEDFTSEVKGSQGFAAHYSIFSELNLPGKEDWGSVTSTLESSRHTTMQGQLDVTPSVLVQPGFTHDQKNGNLGVPVDSKVNLLEGIGNMTSLGTQPISLVDNNLLRIKTEQLPNMGFQNGFYGDYYGQEDLMGAILKQHQDAMPLVENDFGFDGYHLDNLPV